jgi:hypothetical protein
MKTFWSLARFVVAAVAIGSVLEAKVQSGDKAKTSRLDALKRLAGDWVGTIKHGPNQLDVTVNYKVTSGGSAVVETLLAGTEHEMITVFYEDGDDLVLTHYCMLHNQPHMRAKGNGAADKLEFKFDGGTNLKSDKDQHMHDMTLQILNDDHIKAAWTMYKDGKKLDTAALDLKRKKM